jgi:hypothetical protein
MDVAIGGAAGLMIGVIWTGLAALARRQRSAGHDGSVESRLVADPCWPAKWPESRLLVGAGEATGPSPSRLALAGTPRLSVPARPGHRSGPAQPATPSRPNTEAKASRAAIAAADQSNPGGRVVASARIVTGATERLVPRSRPPLPRGQDATRLAADRLHVRTEPVRGSQARGRHRRILERSLTDLRRAEPQYQELIASEPEVEEAAETRPRLLPGFIAQVTIDGMSAGFPRARLDRLWASLVDHGQIVLTVPSLSAAARDQLLRLGAQAEAELGRPVTIFVRQTIDDDESRAIPRPALRARVKPDRPGPPPDPPAPVRPPPPPRPALTVGEDAPRLSPASFQNWLEMMKGDNARAAQKRILHLALVDPGRAELDYQDLIAAEPGQGAADRSRPTDPVKRVTTEGMFAEFGGDELDQFWADLVEHGRLLLTVPSVSAAARDQLLRLGAQAEERLGHSVTILIRETA